MRKSTLISVVALAATFTIVSVPSDAYAAADHECDECDVKPAGAPRINCVCPKKTGGGKTGGGKTGGGKRGGGGKTCPPNEVLKGWKCVCPEDGFHVNEAGECVPNCTAGVYTKTIAGRNECVSPCSCTAQAFRDEHGIAPLSPLGKQLKAQRDEDANPEIEGSTAWRQAQTDAYRAQVLAGQGEDNLWHKIIAGLLLLLNLLFIGRWRNDARWRKRQMELQDKRPPPQGNPPNQGQGNPNQGQGPDPQGGPGFDPQGGGFGPPQGPPPGA